MDFLKIDYLQTGNERQQLAYDALCTHQIFEKLAMFDPILTGTIPINIDIETSDLDIICYWQNSAEFIAKIENYFANEIGFQLKKTKISEIETVIANFKLDGFDVEIFGQPIPTKQQTAYLHMLIEHQILQEMGDDFRLKIIKLKQAGYKTEPAFAKLLELTGNPYDALLTMYS